ncbi:MAG: hypothetical protein FJ057_10045, partial [Cyanobacteria bacterium K_DeepCast_0m_m1_088]|nr:hypothetical protein [Cyanobacteria bacterium K_DeepCast_0m_m1_088]
MCCHETIDGPGGEVRRIRGERAHAPSYAARSDCTISGAIATVPIPAAKLLPLREALLGWWQREGRRRPEQKPWMFRPDGGWPSKSEHLDVYAVMVAEVMLQQTQLQVVLPYWQRWIRAFPSLETLAGAEQEQVLLLWQGLGYYARARRLHQGARQVLE